MHSNGVELLKCFRKETIWKIMKSQGIKKQKHPNETDP
jgi:hypothetical protein